MVETTQVLVSRSDGVAMIVISNPPLNAMGPTISAMIVEAVTDTENDPQVRATIIIGARNTFIAGADIRLLGSATPSPGPGQRATDRIDLGLKPVIAAIDGFALGGGLEIALACHYRIAKRRASFGVPEVLIGVLPGGGGTQRLPRLIGLAPAIKLILGGKRISAQKAEAIGIVDLLVDDDEDLEAAARRFAKSVVDKKDIPRIRDYPVTADAATVSTQLEIARQHAASSKVGNRLALGTAVDAIEAACTSSFEDGMALEQRLFRDLVNTPDAKALRYAFFAEREARKVPGMPRLDRFRPMRTAAVIGAGTMGTGIAMSFADAGIPVQLMDLNAASAARGIARIAATYAASVKRGSIEATERARRLALITTADHYEALADSDMVVEAVFEDAAIKRDIFARLARIMAPGALLLSNTSTIDIDLIADDNPRAGDIAGAHFFSPANVMKLLEVVNGRQTSVDTLAHVFELGRRIDKVPVLAGSCDGFVANRSRMPFGTEVQLMLEEGASPEQIDRVMVEFGFPIGPMMVGDIAGLDIGYAVRKLAAAKNPNFRGLPIPDRLVEMGRHGQKTGAGWYRYKSGSRTPLGDPLVAKLIEDVCREKGIVRRELDNEEVLLRPLLAAVNESCRILEERMAVRPSDIDVMWLNGFGFPRQRGGLMFWADTLGSGAILSCIDGWRASLGPRWEASALMRDLGNRNASFRDIASRWTGNS